MDNNIAVASQIFIVWLLIFGKKKCFNVVIKMDVLCIYIML